MKQAICQLRNLSPYSQSRYHQCEKREKETHKDYEARTWQERLHYNSNGNVFIPPMAFKNCISTVGKFLGVQIPGRGKSTYAKHLVSGVLVQEPLVLPIHKDEVPGEWLFVPADGVRGGTKRVEKCFPFIETWQGTIIFFILDSTITESVFRYHLEQAGQFIGIGRFRPQNNGFYGRFEVVGCEWTEI